MSRRKKKSGFQKLEDVMVVIMAVITLAAIVAAILPYVM